MATFQFTIIPRHWPIAEKTFFICFFVFATLAAPVRDYLDGVLLMLAVMIFPICTIGAILLLVPLWAVGRTLIRLVQQNYRAAFQYFMVPVLGICLFFIGRIVADFIAVQTIGPTILNRVQAVRNGEPAPKSGGLFVSKGEPKMAYFLNGGFLDISKGIAYDETDSLLDMIQLKPSERPPSWQQKAVDDLTCQGRARRIGKNFYLVTVSHYDC